MSKHCDSRIPSRRSGLPQPTQSVLPKLYSGLQGSREPNRDPTKRASTGSTWSDKGDLQRQLSNLPHAPSGVPLAGNYYDQQNYENRGRSTINRSEILLTRLRKDETEESANWRRSLALEPTSPDSNRESWSSGTSARTNVMQTSFSDQLKLITSDDSYDAYGSLPKSAWCEASDEKLDASSVGRKILIGGKQIGYLRYFGQTHFGEGIFCGIELEEKVGRHNGTIDGEIYFRCRPGYGIFAPVSKVTLAQTVIYENESDNVIANRRSDPVCSSSTKYSNLSSSNRYSDCTDDRLNKTDTSVKGSLSYNSMLHDVLQKRKSQDGSTRSSKVIRKRLSHIENSLVSPDEPTADDSSLGILTPNQMLDFTTCSSSCQQSPTDEIVDIPMDSYDGHKAPSGSSKQDTGFLDDENEFLFDEDISMVLKEIHKVAAEVSSSSEASSPHVSDAVVEEPYSSSTVQPKLSCKTVTNKNHQAQENYRQVPASPKSVSFNDTPPEEIFDQYEHTEEPVIEDQIVPVKHQQVENCGVRPKNKLLPPSGNRDHSFRKSDGEIGTNRRPLRSQRYSADSTKLDHSNGSWQPTSMTLSSVSLDPGYQGDGEFDVPSEVGSVSAGTPTHDAQESHIHEEIADSVPPLSLEQCSAETEPDISLAEEENAEVTERSSEKDLNDIQEDDRDDEDDAASDSSMVTNRTARVIDGRLYHSHRELMLRQQEGAHVRGAVADQHASEMDSSGFYSDLDPREEDNTRHDVPSLQPLKEFQDSDSYDGSNPPTNPVEHGKEERKSVSISVQVNSVDFSNSDKEDENNTSSRTNDLESKESNSLEDDKESEEKPEPSKKNEESQKDAEEIKTPRTYEKPWLSKPVIKKPEVKKVFVPPPPPPKPKKNVESKLKAMLAAVPESNPEAEERRAKQAPKKNKWDDVMNKIHEGKEERPKIKEVKSKLMEGLKAPTPVSPQMEKIRQERKERRERREKQQLAAAAAKRNAVRAERKRSSTSNRGSTRTSRAPSIDSLAFDGGSRPETPDSSLASHRSCEFYTF